MKFTLVGIGVAVAIILGVYASNVSQVSFEDYIKQAIRQPLKQITENHEKQSTTLTQNTKPQNCDLSYPDVCIPPYPPDLDCDEISYQNFKVIAPDQHGFDRDKDGIGCES